MVAILSADCKQVDCRALNNNQSAVCKLSPGSPEYGLLFPNEMSIVSRIYDSRLLVSSLVAGALLFCGCETARFPAVDLAGRGIDPLAGNGNQVTVLIFVSNDCPISNRYVPEFRRLRDTFGKRGVGFWMVHADPSETAAQIEDHDRKVDLTIPAVRDPKHRLARLAHAEVTPTAAVFTAGGAPVYCGRIDDRVADLERERPEALHHDLADALEAVLAGRPVPVAQTQAVGCFIPGPR